MRTGNAMKDTFTKDKEITEESKASINWFPGHMTRTLRVMEKEIKNVDALVVLLDARIPYSSTNPEIEKIARNKPKVYVLNKRDLADEEITAQWVKYYKDHANGAVAVNAKRGQNIKAVLNSINNELDELLKRRESRGIENLKNRAMIVGIPNVGKSTLINALAGKSRTKAADKPGVTRGKQWISLDSIDLLDMPGVLWPKFENNVVASNLAFIGSIRDEILDVETLAMSLLSELKVIYPKMLMERYKLTEEELALDDYDLLCLIARKRGMLMSGGVENTERCRNMLLDEFRSSKMGRISLERPPEDE